MILMPVKRLVALAVYCAMFGIAHAQDPLPAETQIVAAPTAAPTTQETFTITTAEDLVVTLTDLEEPKELTSAGVIITQTGAIVGSGQLAAPATSASVSVPGASGTYTLYVFGMPYTSTTSGTTSTIPGTFSVCVAPKTSPSNCIQTVSVNGTPETVSFSGNITAPSAANSTVSTLSTTVNVTTADSYTVTFSDLQFPVPLSTAPSLALFQGSTPIIPAGQTSPGITSGTSLPLSPGTYTLLSIAQADPTVEEGLYGITITGSTAGSTPIVSIAAPVGLLAATAPFFNPAAQSVTLTVADYAFPASLNSASALLTAGGTMVGSASSVGGAQTFAAPAGNLTLWTYGSIGGTGAGTYSADVSAGSTDLYTTAQGVGPYTSSSGAITYSYAFVVPPPVLTSGVYGPPAQPLTTGTAYQATATDLQFPTQLGGLGFAVAQGGAIVQQSATAATLNFTATTGNAILLVSAQAPASTTSPNGIFDINLQTTGTPAALVFDKTQNVSSTPALFNAQTVTVSDSSSYDVTLTDLKFPAAFDSLALVVSRGSEVLGKTFGGGTFSFSGSTGTYQLTFVATPSSDQNFGLYGAAVVYSPPAVTLTSNVSSAAANSNVTLSWTATNATSCTASGGNFTGTVATGSGTQSVLLSETTTFTLTCTGEGGTGSQSVTVTATAAAASSGGGGGALDWAWLLMGGGLLIARTRRNRS